MPSVPAINECFALIVKHYTKADIKVFWSCLDLINFFTFLYVFSGMSVSSQLLYFQVFQHLKTYT